MLLYGQSATGKTTFWATFPGQTLALMCSGGNSPGELRSILTPEYRARIHPYIIESADQIAGFIEQFNEYDNIVLDHISGLEDLFLKQVSGKEEIPAQKTWGTFSMQEYGEAAGMLKDTCRALLACPKNIIIIGQERTFNAKEDGIDRGDVTPSIGAAVMPSVARWLNPTCDYVVQSFKRQKVVKTTVVVRGETQEKETVQGVEYCLRTEPHEIFLTKFRVPLAIAQRLPDVIVNPTYTKLCSVIDGKYESASQKKLEQ